jgi:hypothetical protein
LAGQIARLQQHYPFKSLPLSSSFFSNPESKHHRVRREEGITPTFISTIGCQNGKRGNLEVGSISKRRLLNINDRLGRGKKSLPCIQ